MKKDELEKLYRYNLISTNERTRTPRDEDRTWVKMLNKISKDMTNQRLELEKQFGKPRSKYHRQFEVNNLYFKIMSEEESKLETQLLILGIPSVRGKEKDIVEEGLWDHYSGLPNPLWYEHDDKTEDE